MTLRIKSFHLVMTVAAFWKPPNCRNYCFPFPPPFLLWSCTSVLPGHHIACWMCPVHWLGRCFCSSADPADLLEDKGSKKGLRYQCQVDRGDSFPQGLFLGSHQGVSLSTAISIFQGTLISFSIWIHVGHFSPQVQWDKFGIFKRNIY